MFGKLLKCEYRSYLKTFLPLWVGILLLSALNGLLTPMGSIEQVGFLRLLPLILIFCGFVAAAVISLVLTIQRFWRGLLGSEGYLMFTLPVSRGALLGAKLFTAVTVNIGTAIVGLISVVLALPGQSREKMRELLQPLSGEIAKAAEALSIGKGELPLIWVELGVLIVVYCTAEVLKYYDAMTIGHLPRKHRLLTAVAAYVGLGILRSAVTSGLVQWINRLPDAGFFSGNVPEFLGLLILVTLFLAAVRWVIAHLILRYRLNLD